jgi:hypothetical protein
MLAKPILNSMTGYNIQFNLKPRIGKDSRQKSKIYGNKATQKRKTTGMIFLVSVRKTFIYLLKKYLQ